jgi:hypothetical protein
VQERIEAAKPHWIPAVVLAQEIRDLGYTGGLTLSPNTQLAYLQQVSSFARSMLA